jgi:phospholipase D1/2
MTATSQDHGAVINKVGAAIVDRIVRAAKARERYKIIVVMPAVPAFAGDVQYDSSPGTLAVMELQYKSISRGGHSIMEKIRAAGFDPSKYIRFYNLRSYGRIEVDAAMAVVEEESGVTYESARKEHDDLVGAGYNGRGEGTGCAPEDPQSAYARYQRAARKVGHCTDHDISPSAVPGDDLFTSSRSWATGKIDEIDAIVSEEAYVHSKFLIADDRVIIVGSANLNDRSQLGYRDSEMAVVIEDTEYVDSFMNEKPFQAGYFASSLRRQVFRKHLGLLPRQDPTQPDDSFLPLRQEDEHGSTYDWNSDADRLVQDPLSRAFEGLWTSTARTNSEVFERVFRTLPSSAVRNWEQYEEYCGRLFVDPCCTGATTQEGGRREGPQYQHGHVFKENFPGGVDEVKRELGRVRGTLVEMPLDFLVEEEDLAKKAFGNSPYREELYA